MIKGVGIDTVEVNRIRRILDKENHFKFRYFSQEEIEYCYQQADPPQHFAARLAAKEAFLKAAGIGLTLSFDLASLQVFKGENEKPYLRLTGEFERYAKDQQWTVYHVSMSHTETLATAIVIIE